MKANEAPEKIYIDDPTGEFDDHWSIYQNNDSIEYTRNDAFIEKACEWLKSRQETFDGTGYIAGIVNDKTIEDFRKAMKGE